MGDSPTFNLSQILDWTRGKICNELTVEARDHTRIRGPAVLGISEPADVAFFFSKKYLGELKSAQAGVLVTSDAYLSLIRENAPTLWQNAAVVSCQEPYLAMAIVTQRMATALGIESVTARPGIHPTAVIADSVRLGSDVKVGAHCVIEAGSEIGRGSVLYPGCFVGADVVVGENTVLFPRVTVYDRVRIGSRVRVHSGAVLGSDGFGYAQEVIASEAEVRHQKIIHLGSLRIEDDVEIGANSTLDRGTFGDTYIGIDVKIDNLSHIGHNTEVGRGSALCGQTGLAGNVVLGEYVFCGGNSGVSNGVTVGARAHLAAKVAVLSDVPAGMSVRGNPQREAREFAKIQILLGRLLEERNETLRKRRGLSPGENRDES